MKTSAQRELLPASFRGVPFEVTGSSISSGRRVAVHQYPQRDVPFVEDLGRSKREVSFEAFVTGQDYIQKMQAVIKAIEEPGAGVLVHPWLGRLTVTPTSVGTAKFSSRLLFASISLNFVESGELLYPTAKKETGFLSKRLADAIEGTAIESFIKDFDLSGVQDFVAAAVTGNLSELLQNEILRDVAESFDAAEELAGLTSEALTLLSKDPSVMANQIANALGLGSYVTTVNAWRKVSHQLSKLTRSKACNNASEQNVVRGSSAEVVKKNSVIAENFVRQLTVANIVRASVLIGTPLDRVNEREPIKMIAYDELLSARDEILGTIDAELIKVVDDKVYDTIEQSRVAVWEDMTTRAEQHARLVTYTPHEVVPAVVLAYDYYGDASREAEIVERNGIRHGGFVPVRLLRMMNE